MMTWFLWIADPWIDAPARRQGPGRHMVHRLLDRPDDQDSRRVGFVALDASGVHAALGLHPPLRPQDDGERPSPDPAAVLGTTT